MTAVNFSCNFFCYLRQNKKNAKKVIVGSMLRNYSRALKPEPVRILDRRILFGCRMVWFSDDLKTKPSHLGYTARPFYIKNIFYDPKKPKQPSFFECPKSKQNCSDFRHFSTSEIRAAICPNFGTV